MLVGVGNSDDWCTQNCPPQDCPPRGQFWGGQLWGSSDTMVIIFQFLRMNPNAKYSSEIGCQSLWAVPQLQNNSPSFCPRKIEIKRDATDIWWLALIDTGRLFVTPCQSVWLMDWATRKIPECVLSPLASTKAVSDREIRMFFVSNQPGPVKPCCHKWLTLNWTSCTRPAHT